MYTLDEEMKIMTGSLTAKDIHKDFAQVLKSRDSWGFIEPDMESKEKHYRKKIILEHHLTWLLEKWNLGVVPPKHLIEEIPYYNQLEIYDFVKDFDIDTMDLLVVGTQDAIIDVAGMQKKCDELNQQISERYREMHQVTHKEREELNALYKRKREIMIKKDPIVLYPTVVECNKERHKAYVVVSAWGPEEAALWNLGSLS